MEEHHYAGLSIFLGLASVAVGGGYWYWEYSRRKQRAEERRTRHEKDVLQQSIATPTTAALPQPSVAQSTPVAPPTTATIKQIQHWLNMVANKQSGQSGFLPETGSGDNHTADAIKMFQSAHGMTATGKMDGMTQSLLKEGADKTMGGEEGPYHFNLRWQPAPQLGATTLGGHWVIHDSLHFVLEVPGYTNKNNPPPEHVLTSLLTKHYGPDSPPGVAIREQRFDGWCTGCTPVGAPPLGYGMSRSSTTTTKGAWGADPWAAEYEPQYELDWPPFAPLAPAMMANEWEWGAYQ